MINRHDLTNIVDGALLRALRYPYTLPIFVYERRLIKLMLLHNEQVFFSFSPVFLLFIYQQQAFI